MQRVYACNCSKGDSTAGNQIRAGSNPTQTKTLAAAYGISSTAEQSYRYESTINVETYLNRTSAQKPPIIETYYIQTGSLRPRMAIRVVAKTAMQYINNSNSLSVSSIAIHCNESPLIGIYPVSVILLHYGQSNQIVPNGVSKCLPRMICMHTIKQKIYSLVMLLGVADLKLTNGFTQITVENRQTVDRRLSRFAVIIVGESGIINSQLIAYTQFPIDDR